MMTTRTRTIALVMPVLISIGLYPLVTGISQQNWMWNYIPGLIASGGATLFALFAAARFPKGEPLRRQAFLLALGVSAYPLGSIVWDYYDALGGAPYPGPPDIFFLGMMYSCLGAGAWLAVAAYRQVDRRKLPIMLGLLVAFATLGLGWFGAIRHIVFDPALGFIDTLVPVLYLVGDAFLLLMPATIMLSTLTLMGGALFARPWWYITIGFAVLSFFDSTYSFFEWMSVYESGVVDAGWWISLALVTLGISMLADVHVSRVENE